VVGCGGVAPGVKEKKKLPPGGEDLKNTPGGGAGKTCGALKSASAGSFSKHIGLRSQGKRLWG